MRYSQILQAELLFVFTQENQLERPKGIGHALFVIECVGKQMQHWWRVILMDLDALLFGYRGCCLFLMVVSLA